MKKIFKEAGVILILVALVLSSTAVIGEKENKKTKIETSLSQPNNNIINQNPMTGESPTLWDNGLPDGANGLSCAMWQTYNRILIDDFIVPDPGWIVSDGHFRIVTDLASGPSAITSVIVYFFSSTGPCEPSLVPFAQLTATFNAYLTGNTYFGRPEIAVDCQFSPVTLTPGEWWVCFQPVLEENCYWLTAAQKGCSIYVDYPDAAYERWTWGYDVWAAYYDVSWRLTGEEIIFPGEICCDPIQVIWNEIKAGSFIGDGLFYVWNCGDPGTTLKWAIDSWPLWGGSWTFNPPSGSIPYGGGGAFVNFTFTAPPEKKKVFDGKLKVINVDDPSDFCEIDVHVETPRTRTINGFNFLQWILQKYPNMFPILRNIFI